MSESGRTCNLVDFVITLHAVSDMQILEEIKVKFDKLKNGGQSGSIMQFE